MDYFATFPPMEKSTLDFRVDETICVAFLLWSCFELAIIFSCAEKRQHSTNRLGTDKHQAIVHGVTFRLQPPQAERSWMLGLMGMHDKKSEITTTTASFVTCMDPLGILHLSMSTGSKTEGPNLCYTCHRDLAAIIQSIVMSISLPLSWTWNIDQELKMIVCFKIEAISCHVEVVCWLFSISTLISTLTLCSIEANIALGSRSRSILKIADRLPHYIFSWLLKATLIFPIVVKR